jgi:hypothetical protein
MTFSRRLPGAAAVTAALALFILACEGKQEPFDAGPDAADTEVEAQEDPAAEEPTQDPAVEDTAPADVEDGDESGLCFPNHDGVITRQELRFEVGASAVYMVNADSTTATVDLAGWTDAGVRHWDFSAATADDRRIIDELLDISSRWFAADFPGADYATVLDPGEGILAVYRLTDEALLLVGMVSEEEGKVRLGYDPPVEIIRFPVTEGDGWRVESALSGTYNWLPSTASAVYVVSVDAVGVLRVPAGEFDVTRVRVDLSQTVPFTIFGMENITYTFLSECYGVIARVRSTDGEESAEFTEAAEYRRLTL